VAREDEEGGVQGEARDLCAELAVASLLVVALEVIVHRTIEQLAAAEQTQPSEAAAARTRAQELYNESQMQRQYQGLRTTVVDDDP